MYLATLPTGKVRPARTDLETASPLPLPLPFPLTVLPPAILVNLCWLNLCYLYSPC